MADTDSAGMCPFDETGGGDCRTPYARVRRWLDTVPHDWLELKQKEAELLFRRTGVTFAVYAEGSDPERLIPFDIIPRILGPDEWDFLARGLRQRAIALNCSAAIRVGRRRQSG